MESKSATSYPETNARRGVRLVLRVPLTILGKDRQGKEYAIKVMTVDVSSRGFSISLPRECVASGDDVFISVPTKFNARAKIRWLEPIETDGDMVRCGVELLEPFSNWVLSD
ncbi:MAG: PilZ domain-containing protein [Acidobacteriia bacterium]|nr:PilZ domain-containing protein [Terriglobia bacterium]